MASRGAKSKNGHITTKEYTTVHISDSGVKILKGIGTNHSLPDYAHTPNSIYAKVRDDGSLHSMRFYDSEGWPIIEIAYHPERDLDPSGKRIIHYHTYHNLTRDDADYLTKEMKEKYSKYLKEFDLYDKC